MSTLRTKYLKDKDQYRYDQQDTGEVAKQLKKSVYVSKYSENKQDEDPSVVVIKTKILERRKELDEIKDK